MQLWLECIPLYHYNLSSSCKKTNQTLLIFMYIFCSYYANTSSSCFLSSCGCCNESNLLPHQLLRWNKINSFSFYLTTSKLFHSMWDVKSKLCMNGNKYWKQCRSRVTKIKHLKFACAKSNAIHKINNRTRITKR